MKAYKRLRESIDEVSHLINRRSRHGTKKWKKESIKEVIEEYFPKRKEVNLHIERTQ